MAGQVAGGSEQVDEDEVPAVDAELVEDVLVGEVSIDGMCGVY